ncbi:hypothetical protein PQX77_008140 [Marasmius sp. AFHP31]|nr:hypothetical protein PQX77_008140 [Marasmius sp. AFHP31]
MSQGSGYPEYHQPGHIASRAELQDPFGNPFQPQTESLFGQCQSMPVANTDDASYELDSWDDLHSLIAYYKNKPHLPHLPHLLPQRSFDNWELLSLPPDARGVRFTEDTFGSSLTPFEDSSALKESSDSDEANASGNGEEIINLTDSEEEDLAPEGVQHIFAYQEDEPRLHRTSRTPSPAKSRYPQTIMGINGPSQKSKKPAGPPKAFLTPKATRAYRYTLTHSNDPVHQDDNALEDFSGEVENVLDDSFATPRPQGIAHHPRFLPPSQPPTEPEFSKGEESPTSAPAAKRKTTKNKKKTTAKASKAPINASAPAPPRCRPPSKAMVDELPEPDDTIRSQLRGKHKTRSDDVHAFIEVDGTGHR